MTSFYAEFVETLAWRPRQALEALYWQLTRRRVRARNVLRRDWHLAPDAYRKWIRIAEDNDGTAERLAALAADWDKQPVISLALEHDRWDPADVAEVVAQLAAQPYRPWELLLCGAGLKPGGSADPRIRQVPPDGESCAPERALRAAVGSHLWFLAPGTRVPCTALLHWAVALRAAPDCAVAFGDEDYLDGEGRRFRPWLKPTWQREMLLSQDYISGACLVEVTSARRLLPLTPVQRRSPLYAMLLAMTGTAGVRVTKVAAIQCHRPATDPQDGGQAERRADRLAVLSEHLSGAAEAVAPGPFGSHVVLWPVPADHAPLVSIIVPTKDKADLVRACVESVLAKTTWPAFEVLIVDNNSEEPATFACFEALCADQRVRVIADRRPYNFSAINNAAARQAAGTYLCLLNNDTEVISGDWLDRMMRHAMRDHVGAVGAKLLYPDHTIQHAGVVIGMGNAAGHAHRALPDHEPGYFAQAHLTREATAVTAACLVLDRRKFDLVGGLDEQNFAIAYNDVDLCLKLREAGLTNIYVPAAELFHYESLSRGDDLSAAHRDRYMAELKALQRRWHTETCIDPLHHPLLDRSTEDYVLSYNVSPSP